MSKILILITNFQKSPSAESFAPPTSHQTPILVT